MNATQITNRFAQTEAIETMVAEALDVRPKALPVARRRTGLRRMLLLGLLLLSAWMALATLASLKQINVQLDEIQTKLVAPSR